MDIKTLTLINKRTSSTSKVQNRFLTNFPGSSINLLDIIRNTLDLLDTSIVGHNLVSDILIPNVQFHQIFDQMFVHANELTGQSSSSIKITCKSLKSLVVSENLTGTSSRHRSAQQRISHSMLDNISFKTFPVIHLSLNSPQIRL